jgi:hypothetical protein
MLTTEGDHFSTKGANPSGAGFAEEAAQTKTNAATPPAILNNTKAPSKRRANDSGADPQISAAR